LHIPSAKNEDITIYEDEDFSGKDTNRSQFKKMMNDIKKKKPDYVICYMLDRVSRSVNDFSTLVEYLTSMKINFVSVKEQFDTSTPMGRAMMYITAVFAQLERENLCQRVRDNMLMLSRTGRWLGGTPPIGFDSDAQEIIVNGKIRKSHYLKENKDMELVKLIFQKFIDIGSAFYIARYLSEKGIKTINKKYFYMKSVSDILKNPTYCTADKESYEYFGCGPNQLIISSPPRRRRGGERRSFNNFET
jgi:site-specific DNA recombinase